MGQGCLRLKSSRDNLFSVCQLRTRPALARASGPREPVGRAKSRGFARRPSRNSPVIGLLADDIVLMEFPGATRHQRFGPLWANPK